jgi:hypothetical protein
MQMIEPENRRTDSSRKTKTFLGLLALAFAVTLAIITGARLSNEALAVLAGAVCGVSAAIPTSLIIINITRKRDEPRNQLATYQQQGAYPPVIVVAPPNMQQQPYNWNGSPTLLSQPTQRQFTVVGGEPMNKEVRSL